MEHITSLVRDEIIKLLSAKDIVAMSIALSTFVPLSTQSRAIYTIKIMKHKKTYQHTLNNISSLMIYRYHYDNNDKNSYFQYRLDKSAYLGIYKYNRNSVDFIVNGKYYQLQRLLQHINTDTVKIAYMLHNLQLWHSSDINTFNAIGKKLEYIFDSRRDRGDDMIISMPTIKPVFYTTQIILR